MKKSKAMRMFKLVFLLPLSLFISCDKVDKGEIVGTYEIDKFLIRDNSINVKEYPLMILNFDNTFELVDFNKSNGIKGKWNILKSKGKKEALIEFDIMNKKITATLRGTIFYFEYPNDLYSGKYESLLYVKLK